MIASVLSAAGFKTGLYTSPHLQRIEERMQVDGQPCGDDDFVSAIETIRPVVEAMDSEAAAAGDSGPTWFENHHQKNVGILRFARLNCQAVVLEVRAGRPARCHECLPANGCRHY